MKTTKNWKKSALYSALLLNMTVTPLLPSMQVFAEEVQSTEVKEEKTQKQSLPSTITGQEGTLLSTGEELAKRANPMDVTGLSDEQINALANALYGAYASVDPSFGMSVKNDKGESVSIVFEGQFMSRATGTAGELIPIGWNVAKDGWTAWGDYTQKYHIDGKLAYCVQPGVLFVPGEGFTAQTEMAGISAEQRAQMNRIINFGAKDGDSDEFIAATGFSVWESLGWSVSTSLTNYGDYKAQINKNIEDFLKIPSFNGQGITVKAGEEKRIDDTNGVLNLFKVNVDGTNSNARIEGNTLVLSPTIDSNDGDVDLFRTSYYSGNQYFYVNSNGSQAVTTGGSVDPTYSHIPVKVIKEGDLQIGKQDAITGNMVPNTTYEGTIGDDHVTFTTDETGWSPISSKYIDGTPYNLVEVSVPIGYVLDQTPMTGTIKGGETTKITQKNDIQNAELTVEKTKEVYNAKESTAKGEPVYEMVPAPEIPFTNKSTTDITAPDGKTVIEKAGEYTDTQVTNEEGNATFKPFYNGVQNEYVLTEDETPENYRPMAPKKIVVPYGESSVSVVAHTEKIQNLLKKGKFVFNKKNQIDPKNPLNLAGAKFRLTGTANTNTADVDMVYDTTTESTEMDLKAGKYFVTEIQYPAGFTQPEGQPETIEVIIEDGKTTTIDWDNKPIEPEKPVIPTTPITPKTPVTQVATSTPTKATLPHTGEEKMTWVSILGAMTIVTGTAAYVLYKRKTNATNE